jgi:hypothetical protein
MIPTCDREMVILRVARCVALLTVGQHVAMARTAGLADEDVTRVRKGPYTDARTAAGNLLLRATDELRSTSSLDDETWQALAARYDERQLLNLVFTIGQYDLLAMVLNATAVELDEGLEGLGAERDHDFENQGRDLPAKDSLLGHRRAGGVFNPNYSRYVADTITDFFDAVGVSWDMFTAHGYHLVLARTRSTSARRPASARRSSPVRGSARSGRPRSRSSPSPGASRAAGS